MMHRIIIEKLLKYFPVIIASIAALLYYPSIFGEFLLDDNTYFFNNKILTSLTPLDFKEIFLMPSNYWGELLPVRDYLYVVEYSLFGTSPVGYHIVSIVIYLASAFILYLFIKALFNDYILDKNDTGNSYFSPHFVGCIAMSLFLLHPSYVEVTAYISGQKDLLSVFFILASILFLHRAGKIATTNHFWKPLIIGLLLHYLAVLSKLSGVASILFVPLLWLVTSRKKIHELYKISIAWLVGNIPVVIWFFYNLKVSSIYVNTFTGSPFLERIPRAFNLLGANLTHAVWPSTLSSGYPADYSFQFNLNFITGVLLSIIAMILLYKKRQSLILLGALIFITYLLPVLQIFPEMNNAWLYDRYLAIPLVGIIIILLLVLYKLYFLSKNIIYIPIGLLVVIFTILGNTTYNYIPAYKNIFSLYENNYLAHPGYYRVAEGFYEELINQSQLTRAEKILNNDIRPYADEWEVDYLQGLLFVKKNNIDEGYRFYYNSSVKAAKAGLNSKANLRLAMLYVKRGEYNFAKTLLTESISRGVDPIEYSKMVGMLEKIEILLETEKVNSDKKVILNNEKNLATPEVIINDITVAELLKNKEMYNNKIITLKGEVIKYNPAIMKANWFHIQDGTHFNGKRSITVTTRLTVSKGDTVKFKGKVTLNKNFGSGYIYDILIEDAVIIK